MTNASELLANVPGATASAVARNARYAGGEATAVADMAVCAEQERDFGELYAAGGIGPKRSDDNAWRLTFALVSATMVLR